MVGIDPNVISHKLNVDPTFKPIKQKRRKFAPERNKVINDEVDNLLKIGKIREVKYPAWLANVVVVQKKNGKWRVCMDFTDLVRYKQSNNEMKMERNQRDENEKFLIQQLEPEHVDSSYYVDLQPRETKG
ncbi:hypothetical protein OSB04_un000642 [Centaurea solstitialis]|uniref:Reverse transcriptase n=1 Tax=Centaurea solstitialis TaxID=347529 RepID=A0AA38VRN5_9ASTR|nr:hypothetical protein OSB04_un000642 [Centaurea solstitialis]